MFMEERQQDIVKRINESGRILVSEIQSLYHVSADCARRDLRLLESRLQKLLHMSLPRGYSGLAKGCPSGKNLQSGRSYGGKGELSGSGKAGGNLYPARGCDLPYHIFSGILYGAELAAAGDDRADQFGDDSGRSQKKGEYFRDPAGRGDVSPGALPRLLYYSDGEEYPD